ncbi:hypothetical protein HYG77_34140 (plasmid) [Rhodococcus sp. ZPP]|uniref:hypothetical protein n=1 Tax=Rhodococcus sp. ZPP TaxID=2749906 RepID=UPI001AD85B8E|nr:hypothetical protein [Rhodococcus sp. ZPP]QTJ70551.1 hypothetical protein HYG77_34140 [Rhodococcus sp. ZPP]
MITRRWFLHAVTDPDVDGVHRRVLVTNEVAKMVPATAGRNLASRRQAVPPQSNPIPQRQGRSIDAGRV